MRQRITFLHKPEDAFDASQLLVDQNKLAVKNLRAAREDRITFGQNDLPPKLLEVLSNCNELYIRWVSSQAYTTIAPFSSRLSSGLHIFFTPTNATVEDTLSKALIELLGEDSACASNQHCFTSHSVQETRFSNSAVFQYYTLLPSLTPVTTQLQGTNWLCPSSSPSCLARLDEFSSASYIDIDYKAISQDLVLTGFWSEGLKPGGWNEEIRGSTDHETIEVGILANEKPTELEEISLGGFLTIVGEDYKASPTLFSFPARHHQWSEITLQRYKIAFGTPAGLHPNLQISFPTALSAPPGDHCALHAYLTLPSYLFIDKYQVTDPLFLASKNVRNVRSIYGETDLEAPDWILKKWGSNILVEILDPSEVPLGPWSVEVPLHLRYLEPESSVLGLINVQVPWPVVFWACTAEDGTKMSVNPFDRTHLGYDGLFGPKTLFYHLEPNPQGRNGSLLETFHVPVMALEKARWVEEGTIAVIILGFVWIVYVLISSMLHMRSVSKVGNNKKRQ